MTALAFGLYAVAALLQGWGIFDIVRDLRRDLASAKILAAKLPPALDTGWPDPVAAVLAEYVETQAQVNEKTRWAGVWILLAGLVIGTAANFVALFA